MEKLGGKTMKMTSAQAAKLLRQLKEELYALQVRENNSRSFLASLDEDPESARPDYDYNVMKEEMNAVEVKIRKLKHIINVFNTTTIIPEFGITIDEMLVLIPQLSANCSRLAKMKDALPKVRDISGYRSNIIDYRYVNYDIGQVKKDYTELYNKLAKAQTALDYVNSTVEMEVDI